MLNSQKKSIVISSSVPNFAVACLVLGAIAIAFAPIFVRLSPVGPVSTAFWRISLSLPIFLVWRSLEPQKSCTAKRPKSSALYFRLFLAGFFFAADLSVWHWSIRWTSVANATFLSNLAPVFVTLGGILFFKSSIKKQFILGMFTALIGTLLLIGQHFRLDIEHLRGDIFGVFTAVFYAAYLLTVKDLRNYFSTAVIMGGSGVAASLVLLPLSLISGEIFWSPVLQGWWVLLGLAFISHSGGQGLIAFSLAHLPAAFSSLTLLIQPVSAALLAWFLFNESLSMIQIGGCILILSGIWVARQSSV